VIIDQQWVVGGYCMNYSTQVVSTNICLQKLPQQLLEEQISTCLGNTFVSDEKAENYPSDEHVISSTGL
jgi:DNA-binding FrmR family transcriptional regulator